MKKNHGAMIRKSWDDRIFNTASIVIVCLLTLVVLLPMLNVVACAFSSPKNVGGGRVLLWPVEFTLENFKLALKYRDVWIGYRNTIFYTTVGTFINVIMTLLCAYPLSVKTFSGRHFFNRMFLFTMLFGGGMIANYLLISSLKLLNTIWAVLLPGAMSVYNVMVTRTNIESSIPAELEDSARVDGCSYFQYFWKFVLPLSKPIIAVIAMYYAVGHWNSYFTPFLYLNKRNLYPLQLFLREILINTQIDSSGFTDPELVQAAQNMADTLKYTLIVVSTLPLMCIYPFVQKYFVKGVMIGAVKG